MGKPPVDDLLEFRRRFLDASRRAGKNQFLTYYMIAAHPGCEDKDMRLAKRFTSEELQLNPEQVQIFTPLPSSWSSVMYWTGVDPFTGRPLFVERDPQRKQAQKDILTRKTKAPAQTNPVETNRALSRKRGSGKRKRLPDAVRRRRR